MRLYDDPRHLAAMPAERVAVQSWLIAGRLLFAPFAPRDDGLAAHEAEAIEAMGLRLQRDRRAGLLPDCVAFWLRPSDGRTTPLTTNQAWLRSRVMQSVVVDLGLLEAMGRVVPLTLLPATVSYAPRVPGRTREPVRRASRTQASIGAVAAA